MGPIGHAGDVSVFHGIEMNVVGVALQIGVIANGVLPIAALPYALFTLDRLAGRSRGRRIKTAGKAAFDQAPAGREVCVSGRQRPECMKVTGQYADCDRFKRAAFSNQSIALSEALNFTDQQTSLTVVEYDREKENASFDLGAAILRHGKFDFARVVGTAQERLCYASNWRRVDKGALAPCPPAEPLLITLERFGGLAEPTLRLQLA
jgi:hypothetical protein